MRAVFYLVGIFRTSVTSLVTQVVKCPAAVRESWVQLLGQEDPLEKETAPHSSILAWKTPWTEKLGSLQSMGWQRVGHIHNHYT